MMKTRLQSVLILTFAFIFAAPAMAGVSFVKVQSSAKCLDLNAASSALGLQLQQYDCNGSKAQAFDFVQLPNGLYEIRTQTGSNLCLDVANASSTNFTAIQQYSCNGSRAQQFELRARGSGFEIRTVVSASTSCLDVSSAETRNGAKLIQYACNGGANQLFQLSSTSAPSPTPAPVTQPSALSLSSPAGASTVSGRFQITGVAGTAWKNIATYDINKNYAKIASDVTPVDGRFSISIDSSLMANGTARIAIIAFSVAAGQTGGSSSALELRLNINNVAAAAVRPLPISGSEYGDYALTFEDRFSSAASISLGDTYTGAKWYNGTKQCCMVDSTGLPGVMFPTAVNGKQVNPYSILPGGGLAISLEKVNNVWYSGILTSVDKNQMGFAQKYGYFEMQAQMPAGDGVWPAFWMLSTDPAMPGEIDIMEYYGHDNGTTFGITLHDWRNGGNNAFEKRNDRSFFPKVSGMTTGLHKYGFLWTETTMVFFYDDREVYRTATPEVMKQPYYFVINNGLGGYWPTQNTPASSQMQIKSIRAYGVK